MLSTAMDTKISVSVKAEILDFPGGLEGESSMVNCDPEKPLSRKNR